MICITRIERTCGYSIGFRGESLAVYSDDLERLRTELEKALQTALERDVDSSGYREEFKHDTSAKLSSKASTSRRARK